MLLTSDYKVMGSNLTRIQLMSLWHFLAQSLLISSSYCLLYDLNNVERDVKCQIIINVPNSKSLNKTNKVNGYPYRGGKMICIPSEKGSALKEKNLLPQGANSFLF